MAKFGGGCLDHAGFNAIKEQLTASFAAAIEQELQAMGDAVKGISWFSSCADQYSAELYRQAA